MPSGVWKYIGTYEKLTWFSESQSACKLRRTLIVYGRKLRRLLHTSKTRKFSRRPISIGSCSSRLSRKERTDNTAHPPILNNTKKVQRNENLTAVNNRHLQAESSKEKIYKNAKIKTKTYRWWKLFQLIFINIQRTQALQIAQSARDSLQISLNRFQSNPLAISKVNPWHN